MRRYDCHTRTPPAATIPVKSWKVDDFVKIVRRASPPSLPSNVWPSDQRAQHFLSVYCGVLTLMMIFGRLQRTINELNQDLSLRSFFDCSREKHQEPRETASDLWDASTHYLPNFCALCMHSWWEKLHSAMSNIALASMAGGLYTIYTNKERLGKPHWTSWHAWVGLLALGLWAVNVAIAGTNTADLEGKRLVFLWQSRNHRCKRYKLMPKC